MAAESCATELRQAIRRLFWFRGVQVDQVLIVFKADVFQQIPAGPEINSETGGPGLGVRDRVLDGGLIRKGIEVGTAVSFDNVQFLGGGMPNIVQPRPAIETNGVHD